MSIEVSPDRQPSAFRLADTAWIVVIATVAMLPTLLWGPSRSHSSTLNYVWAAQFAEVLGQSHLYPRWLPRSFQELGSPTFFFYPPLSFYPPALLDLAGFSTLQALSVAALLMTLASGVAMYVWLRVIGGHAVLGALLYMVAPYYLLDH